jgi:predicted nuclease with TOPRIM domain
MPLSSRFLPGGSSKSTPAQSSTSNSFNALSDLPLDFNDLSDNGLTQEGLDSEHIDFDSMGIDAIVVKAGLATVRSISGKTICSAPENKGSESVTRLLNTMLQQTAMLNNFMSQTTKTNSEISDSLSSLVNKIANFEIQMSVLCDKNEDLKIKMVTLNKRVKDLESSLELD